MLAITAFLYHFSYSQLPSNTRPVFDAEKVATLHRTGAQSPAWNLWQTLNPNDDALVHLRIEEPTLVTFDTQVGEENPRLYSPSLSHSRVTRYIVRITKVIIIPIGATTFSLWLLLLFLLKDAHARQAELAAQENELQSDAKVDSRFKFITLPRGCEADVDQVAAAPDGRTVVSVSFDNEVVVWSIATGDFFNLPVDDLDDQGSVVTTVAVDSVGNFCAVGTRAGVIALWLLKKGQPVRRQLLRLESIRSRVLELVFEDRPAAKSTTERPTMLHRRSTSGDTTITEGFLLASYKNGNVVEWNDLYDSKPVLVFIPQPSEDYVVASTRAVLLRPGANEGVYVAVLYPDGHVQIFKRTMQEWKAQQVFLPTLPGSEDVVVRLHGQIVSLDLSSRLIIATGARSGFIALWDGVTGEQLYALEELYEDVNRIRVASIPTRICPTCSEMTPDSFIVTISCGTSAHIHTFALNDPRRCTCPVLQPSGMQTPTAARSRNGSVGGFGVGSSPIARKAKLPGTSMNGTADFPVSGHGHHSRRASDKEPGRRQASDLLLNVSGDEAGLKWSGSCLKLNSAPGMNGVPSRSNDVRLELQQARVADVSFRQGAWDVMGHVVYGLRRSSDLETLLEDVEFASPRAVDSNAQRSDSHTNGKWTGRFEGLDLPVLDRWLLWTFDPTSIGLSVRTSSLASLCITPLSFPTVPCDGPPSRLFNRSSRASIPPALTDNPWSFKKQSAFPRLSFTEISSLVTVGQETCIAAFGNTVGLISLQFGPAPIPHATSHSRISALSSLTTPPSTNDNYKKRL
jgi:WD40 repeat protein